MTTWDALPVEIKGRIMTDVCNVVPAELYSTDVNYKLSKGQRKALLRLCGVNRELWDLAGQLLWHTLNVPCRPGLLSKLAVKSGLKGRLKYIKVVKITAGRYQYGANATKDVKWVQRCVNEFANVLGQCRSVSRLELELDHHALLLGTALPKSFFLKMKSLRIDGHNEPGLYQIEVAQVLQKCGTSVRNLEFDGFSMYSLLPTATSNCHQQGKSFHAAVRNLSRLEQFSLTASSAPLSLYSKPSSLAESGTAHLGFKTLRILHLTGYQAQASALLGFTQAPLEQVSLECWSNLGNQEQNQPQDDPRQVILRLLEQHKGHLKRLCVADAQLPPGEAWAEVEQACALHNVEVNVTMRVSLAPTAWD